MESFASIVYRKSSNNCDSCENYQLFEEKFLIIEKDGKELIDNSGEWKLYGKKEIRHIIEEKYQCDKKRYLVTGTWPKVHFCLYDESWAYYNCLKLSDLDVTLKNYLDFDYDSSDWPREKLMELIYKYGTFVLFYFLIYLDCNSNMPFEDWYKGYYEIHSISPKSDSDSDFDDNSKILIK